MALLQVNEDWRIDSDPLNWILQKRQVSKDTGKVNWKNEGYYPTLPMALKGMTEMAIKLPANIQGVENRLNELYMLIDDKFTADDAIQRNAEPESTKGVEEDGLEDLLS